MVAAYHSSNEYDDETTMRRWELRRRLSARDCAAIGVAIAAVLLAACSPAERDAVAVEEFQPQAQPSTPATSPPTTTTTTSMAPKPERVVPLPELAVWTFPGPNHYEGDLLTFQVPVGGFGRYDLVDATIAVDGRALDVAGVLGGDPLLGDVIIFRDALDTSGATGGIWVEVSAQLEPGLEIDVTQRIVVRSAEGRPSQELDTDWLVQTTGCCNVTYLENSAAERDLAELTTIIDDAAEAVEAHFGLELPLVDFVLIDTLWGNGGYAGSEVVVSYLDRDYSPGRQETFRQTVLHELAHAITDQMEVSTPWPLIEGVAVQFTRGHFKPEPLGSRAKALSERGELPTVEVLFDTFQDMQHETRYAAVGAFTEFLVVEFGLEDVFDIYDSDITAVGSQWLDQATREVLGEDLDEIQKRFDEWVRSFEAAEQSLDLELTIALQEARRMFQVSFDPYPNYFIYDSVTATGQDSLAMRDATNPTLVAVEALIAYGQDLIIAGDLETAAAVVTEVERIVAEGTVGPGLSGEFLEIAEAVDEAGYELVEYVPSDAGTTVVATGNAPDLTIVDLEEQSGEWVVVDTRPAPESTNALGL